MGCISIKSELEEVEPARPNANARVEGDGPGRDAGAQVCPDDLLVHPMDMDDLGHKYGAESSEYRRNAVVQDVVLANLVPEWMERGYDVLVTGDHGMSADKMHGGVPGEGGAGEVISQLQIAPTVCKLLGVPIPETMEQPSVVQREIHSAGTWRGDCTAGPWGSWRVSQFSAGSGWTSSMSNNQPGKKCGRVDMISPCC